jgi:CTP:molybdopterin cytidylyltransferase MocA
MVHALLLAAGRASRFGADKLLAPLRGKPLLVHTATAVAQAIEGGVLGGGVAIIPAGAKGLAWPLETATLTVIENPEAGAGISTSIQRGLASLAEERPLVNGALIVLADQPWLSVDVISQVVNGWRKSGRTTRPRYAGAPAEPGHPVLLDRSDWPLADQLTGDQGLRQLLDGQAVTQVDVPGVNPDVDTPADLRRLEDTR